MTLTEIANENKTDKGTQWYEKHGYTEEYKKYIPSKGVFMMIEIGVWNGDSIRMWRQYNKHIEVHGIDNDRSVLQHISPAQNIYLHFGDQADREFLLSIVKEYGQPNFVIDDGSHRKEDILASFKVLYDKLIGGGYYFIEDLHAQYAEVDSLYKEILKWLETRKVSKIEFLCNKKLLLIQK
jgi:cephalosporin hydroxylase